MRPDEGDNSEQAGLNCSAIQHAAALGSFGDGEHCGDASNATAEHSASSTDLVSTAAIAKASCPATDSADSGSAGTQEILPQVGSFVGRAAS